MSYPYPYSDQYAGSASSYQRQAYLQSTTTSPRPIIPSTNGWPAGTPSDYSRYAVAPSTAYSPSPPTSYASYSTSPRTPSSSYSASPSTTYPQYLTSPQMYSPPSASCPQPYQQQRQQQSTRNEHVCLFIDCTYSCARKADLERHVTVMHNHNNASRTDCEVAGCHRRGQQGFTRKDKMRDHMRDVHKCDIPKRSGGGGKRSGSG